MKILLISLDAGNTTAVTTGVTEFDGNATDSLDVDGVSYTFPLGGTTAFVADNGDASAFSQSLVLMADQQTH